MNYKTIILQTITVLIGSFLLACSYNLFFIPNGLLSGGVTGISLIISQLTNLNAGIFNLLFNIPILILGYLKLGRKFMIYTILSVVATSVSMMFIPVNGVVDDILLGAVYGGVILGISCGIIFRAAGSSGGFDVISLVILLKRDFSLGVVTFSLNFVIIFVSGFLFGWELALYTMLGIYVGSKVIDVVHTKHVKLTLMIVTEEGDKLEKALLKEFGRGITAVEGKGAYTNNNKDILYMIITRYELSEVKAFIREVAPDTFINITETVEVVGSFKKI